MLFDFRANTKAQVMIQLIRAVGPKRMMFGSDLPILRMAYLIERDFAEFYSMAASKAEGAARAALEKLAERERAHEMLFKGMHDSAFEEYAQMPWGG